MEKSNEALEREWNKVKRNGEEEFYYRDFVIKYNYEFGNKDQILLPKIDIKTGEILEVKTFEIPIGKPFYVALSKKSAYWVNYRFHRAGNYTFIWEKIGFEQKKEPVRVLSKKGDSLKVEIFDITKTNFIYVNEYTDILNICELLETKNITLQEMDYIAFEKSFRIMLSKILGNENEKEQILKCADGKLYELLVNEKTFLF